MRRLSLFLILIMVLSMFVVVAQCNAVVAKNEKTEHENSVMNINSRLYNPNAQDSILLTDLGQANQNSLKLPSETAQTSTSCNANNTANIASNPTISTSYPTTYNNASGTSSNTNFNSVSVSTTTSTSVTPHLEYTSSLNTTSITTAHSTDYNGVAYYGNLTAYGKVNVSNIPIDYILTLDSSGSVGQTGWSKTITWAINFIQALKSSDRVAIIVFSTNAQVKWSFNDNQDRTVIANALANMPYLGGWTYTKDAVQLAINQFNTYSTPQTPKFLFMVTDGVPDPSTQDPCGLKPILDSLQISTLIIGVGVQFQSNALSCLVNDPIQDIITVDDYNSLTFNPQEISTALRNLINVTATNIELTLVFNPPVVINSVLPTPTSVSGNNLTWDFNRIKENDSILFFVNVSVTGSGVVPIATADSSLTYTPVLETSTSMNLAELSVQITIVPPIIDLFNAIREKILSLGLNNGNTNSLLVKLDHAYQDYLNGDYNSAVQRLVTLEQEINALVNPGKISQTDADWLDQKIDLLMNLLQALA